MLKKFAGETIRYFVLSTHYRRPIDYSEERITEVEKGLATFYRFFQRYERVTGENFYNVPIVKLRTAGDQAAAEAALPAELRPFRERFLASMDDDFNTGGAIGVLHELVTALNRLIETGNLEGPGKNNAEAVAGLKAGAGTLRELAATLGLFRGAEISLRLGRWADRQAARAVDRAAGRITQGQELRPLGSNSRPPGRARRYARRSSRRHRLDDSEIVAAAARPTSRYAHRPQHGKVRDDDPSHGTTRLGN